MTDLPVFLFKNGSYINGTWHTDSADKFSVFNPADGTEIASLCRATQQEARLAVAAARDSLKDWQSRPAKEKSSLLRQWYSLIIKFQDDLAHIMTAEQGKPLAESKAEIIYAANYIDWFAEEAKRIYGDTIAAPSNDKRIVVIKQGIGVVSAITPWNFPSSMITRKAAPALAAGCTFIVKPAAETPLSALALATLAEDAGIPAGVFNVIVSDKSREIGEVLTKDPAIGKFSFTGSTEVGRKLLEQCSSTVKKTTMELGGNAPFIVFDDADIDEAIQGAMQSKYRNAGQTCVCSNRIFVQSSIYEEFAEKLTKHVRALKTGNGFADQVDIGPLVNAGAVESVDSLVQGAIQAGATVLTGGKRSVLGPCFYEPTVLANVAADMDIAMHEIFGPVAPLIKFDTEAEVIAMANATEFGLASYIYTRDIGRIWRVSEALEFGMVGINEGIISNEMAPFGGVKQSGMGREGSKYGLDDYLEIKYLCMGGINK
tara:strand:- start:13699 stop:15156 length:1458 start_codon:yes stop_codon:yes gene_type:complete